MGAGRIPLALRSLSGGLVSRFLLCIGVVVLGSLALPACSDPSGPDAGGGTGHTADASGSDTPAPADSADPQDDTDPPGGDSADPPDDTGDTGEPGPEPEPEGWNLCGDRSRGERASGTHDDPIEPPSWPMVDVGTTLGAPTDDWDRYDCAPDTLETGPEVLYRFTVTEPGDFRAELRELGGSDVDLHLLSAPTVADGLVSGCIARGHQRVEVLDLPAGEYWLALDSWSNGTTEYAGEYEVAFEWVVPETWREVEVTDGLTWRSLRTDADGGQTVQVVEVDLSTLRRMEPADHPGCETVADRVDALGAVAGINGGFFGVSTCTSLDFVKGGGTVYSTNGLNGLPQRAIGWTGSSLAHTWLDTGIDWPAVTDGISGYPSLVTGGAAAAEREPGVQVVSSTDWSNHPRSALGVTASGNLLMVTFAGRTSAGAGLTTPRLAEWMVDLGAVDAVNLDGGGSTSMVVPGCWVDGVVSQPSDNGAADWRGSRGVADGVYVY